MKRRQHHMAHSPSKPLSPEPVRRTALNRQRLSVYTQDKESLSSSLPSALSREEVKHLKAMEKAGKPRKRHQSNEDLQDHLAVQQAAHSSPEPFRQRSISLSTTSLNSTGLSGTSLSRGSPSNAGSGSFRRGFLGFSRSRSSSARLVHTKSTKQSSEVAHSGQDACVKVHKVDVAFLQIKQQLKQFSEEDFVMQDRINRLMTDITNLMKLHRFQSLYSSPLSHKNRHFVDLCALKGELTERQEECVSVATSVTRQTPSYTSDVLLSDVEEVWQEESLDKSSEVNKTPFQSSCEQYDFCEIRNLKHTPKVSEIESFPCKGHRSVISEASEQGKLSIMTLVPTLMISQVEDDVHQPQ